MEVFMDEEEKRLLDGYKRLSPRSRYIALAQIIAGVEMEENARRMAEAAYKKDSRAGPDAPLFNGRGLLKDEPSYALPEAGPVMGAQI
jgi:hypothetical protein